MELGDYTYLWDCHKECVSVQCRPSQTPHTNTYLGLHHPRSLHHYLHCCRNLSQPCFINLVGCRASLHVPACIFPTLLSRLLPKPIAPRWTTKSSGLCQRASTDLLLSYFQHFLFRRSAMTAPLSLLAGRLWHVSRSEFQHAWRHLIRRWANRCVSWAHT